jgi:hypothetical protein
MNFQDQIKHFFRSNPLLSYLIIGDFVLILIFGGRFFEALFNAYLVYFGGTIFKYYIDRQRMLNVLIGGAVFGAVLTILVVHHYPILFYFKSALTAGSIALFVAAATYVPNMEVMLFFLGRVKLKWIAFAFVALDLINIHYSYPYIGPGDIAGAAFGFLLIYFGRNRSYVRTPNFLKWFMRPRGPYYKKPKTKANPARHETDEEYNARKKREQDEVDAILEKIKQKGYDSLTASEKQKLFDRSKNG